MYCVKCGQQVADDAKFCPSCGAMIGGDASVQPTKSAAPRIRMETKTIEVTSSQESKMIGYYEAFGWEFVSNQDIKTVDSHLERIGDTIYSVTEREQYIKLTFRRPVEMPAELIKLEEDFWKWYHNISIGSSPSKWPHIIALVYGIGLIFSGVVFLFMSSGMGTLIERILGSLVLVAIGGIAIHIYHKLKDNYKLKDKQYSEDYTRLHKERTAAMNRDIEEAQKYL